MKYMTGGNVSARSYVAYITRALGETIQQGLDANESICAIVDAVVELKAREMQKYCSEKGTDGKNDYFSNVWSMARRAGANNSLPESQRKEFLARLQWASWRHSNQERILKGPDGQITTGESWARNLERNGG